MIFLIVLLMSILNFIVTALPEWFHCKP